MNLNLGDTQLILKYCKKYGLTRAQAAYVLATAYWETAQTMKPVKEAFWLSESWRKNNLRYYPWYGRGYVQLTWEYNYEKAEDKLNVPATSNPEVVMKPDVAARVIVLGMKEGWFTTKSLLSYVNDETTDYNNARRVVNGMDKHRTIASIAEEYYEDLVDYDKPVATDWLSTLMMSLFNWRKK